MGDLTSTTPTKTSTDIQSPDTVSDTNSWSPCSKTCGEGLKFRRECSKAGNNSECEEILTDPTPCSEAICTGKKQITHIKSMLNLNKEM